MRFFAVMVIIVMSCSTVFAKETRSSEEIFKKKCKGCHRLSDGSKMGPGLLGVTKRRSEEWLDKWLLSPRAMIESGDETAVALKKKYKKTMRSLKVMKDDRVRREMIEFLKKNDSKLD